MYDSVVVVVLIGIYIGILFLIALVTERRQLKGSSKLIAYSLALGVYCTSWTFYGSVGSAATGGTLFLTIYLGPTLSITLWWFVLRKLVRIKTSHRITSIADMISARYDKSQSIAALATLMALIGTTPYIALQLKAVTDTFKIITTSGGTLSTWIGNNADLVVVALMVVFTIIFGVRRLDPTERHDGVVMALAVKSGVKLAAFLAAGIFVTFFMYDGFGDIFEQLAQSDFSDLLNLAGKDTSSYLTWMSYLVLAMSAIMFLPRQFHVAVVENSDEKHIRTAMWAFPLYMFLINIFVVPIAVGGLLQGYPAQEADTFVLNLPLQNGQPWLALLVFFGGLSAAVSMIIVSAMTTSTMVTNHLFLPLVERAELLGFLRKRLLQVRWVAVALVVIIGYVFARLLGDSYTLVNMGLISFAAVLQFAPIILGGVFWRRGNKTGAILGLSAGFITWAYTLFIPSLAKSGWLSTSFIDNGPFGIGLLKPEQFLGLEGVHPLVNTVVWTMIFNIGFYVLGSLYSETSREEQRLRELFVDALAADATARPLVMGEARIQLAEKRTGIENLLHRYLPSSETHSVVKRCLDQVGIQDKSQISVVELANLRSEVEKNLAGSIGAAAAHHAVSQARIFTEEEASELSEVYSDILANLMVSPEELRGRIDFYQERDALLARQAKELEERVAEATRDLAIAAEVGHAATLILDPDQLIGQVVDLIRERFGFYYVGLFIVDATQEWAVLRAGTGAAGRALVERTVRTQIGQGSMIGWCIASKQARFLQDVKDDPIRMPLPELPDTQSEAAVPLQVRGNVIGALSVEDDKPGTFDENTVQTLQVVADQIAVALENAQLLQRAQESLEAERRAYGQISREAWAQKFASQPDWGYACDRQGVVTSSGRWQYDMAQAIRDDRIIKSDNGSPSIAIPVRVRDQVVGALNFSKESEGDDWTDDEIALIQTLTEQLSTALDSARLYQDIQLRAAQEQITGEITSRMRESLDVDNVLQTAVREMRSVLNLAEVEIQIGEPEINNGKGEIK